MSLLLLLTAAAAFELSRHTCISPEDVVTERLLNWAGSRLWATFFPASIRLL